MFKLGKEIKEEIKFLDKEQLRFKISNNRYDLISNIAFNVYFEYVEEIKNFIIENYNQNKAILFEMILSKNQTFKQFTNNHFFEKLSFQLENNLSRLTSYYFTILCHFYYNCSITNMKLLKSRKVVWVKPMNKINDLLGEVKVTNTFASPIFGSSIYFLKKLYGKKIKEVLNVFRVFDSSFDYNSSEWDYTKINDNKLVDEIVDLLPSTLIIGNNFHHLIGMNCIDGSIAINSEFIDFEFTDEQMEKMKSINNLEEEFNYLVNIPEARVAIVQLVIILIHEMCHKKRILKLSKGLLYLYSPLEDNNKKTLAEAGRYGEISIFGKEMCGVIRYIDDGVAKLLLDLNNWEDSKKLQEIIKSIKTYDSISDQCMDRCDDLSCYDPKAYDLVYISKFK